MAESSNKPVHEIRLGRIKAAIWANDTEHGARYGVAICRLYKDGDQWKETTSFGRDDLLVVAKIADTANTWIYENSGNDG